MNRLSLLTIGAALALSAYAPSVAAESVEDLGRQIVGLDAEATRIASGIRTPVALSSTASSSSDSARQLVDAQLYFGMGNYDDSAVILYDFVEKNPNNPAYGEGLYYLAESLYKKGDLYASRTYFKKLVNEEGAGGKFYQQGLERLIELNIELDDASDEAWISKIDALPENQRRSASPYVRGKYEHHKGRFDEAITWFNSVPKNSKHTFQATYYKGVSLVAKGDLKQASEAFRSVVAIKPTRKAEARVVELAHLALGRLYYERNQPSKAVDAYLNVNRKSDLFDEALYEVAWVYVKDRKQEKALRSLELMELADPKSHHMPEVRILEGNLRIQRARAFAVDGKGNPTEEYGKAINVFEETHEAFYDPQQKLDQLIKEHPDPRVFLTQITGRERDALSAESELPEVAAAWLRREPEVERVVKVESDLGQIHDEIAEAEATIDRLELALTSSARVNFFPKLANNRIRTVEIEEELYDVRTDLLEKEHAIASKYANGADLAGIKATRTSIQTKLAALPNANLAESERIGRSKNNMSSIDTSIAEATTVARTTEAQLTAVERYFAEESANISAEQQAELDALIKETRQEINTLNGELEEARNDTVLARDQAGVGDEVSYQRNLLKSQLSVAMDEEHRSLTGILANAQGGDRSKADALNYQMTNATSVQLKASQAREQIDKVADVALAEVQKTLASEKEALAAYKQEYVSVNGDSEVISADAVAASFAGVLRKFDDIIIQSDVGLVDVAWSLRESVDEGSRRMTLAQARERRSLDAEFASIMREIEEAETSKTKSKSGQGANQ